MLSAAVLGSEPLPDCKIKRNYLCMLCAYFTQNPRLYLHHLRDVHNEKMRIYECNRCSYASKHSQKLHRHIAMVHAANKPPRRRPSWAQQQSNAQPPQQLQQQPRATQQQHRQPLPPLKLKMQAFSSSDVGVAPYPVTSPDPAAVVIKTELPEDELYDDEAGDGFPDDDDDDDDDDDSNDRLVIEYPEEEDERRAGGDGEGAEGEGEGGAASGGGEEEEEEESGEAEAPAAADEDVQEHAVQHGGADLADSNRLEMDPVTRHYKCSSCAFQSKTPSLVTRHESVVHLKRRFYRCNKCTYVTHLKARFTKHYKYHTMPLIKCSECDFRTPYKWNLDRHLKNHNGVGAYRCSVCSFAADIKQSLTVHEMNHHNPPVSGPVDRAGNRRRCKVGGSDCRDQTEEDGIEEHERELLRMEREGCASDTSLEALLNAVSDSSGGGSVADVSKSRPQASQSPEKPNRSKTLRCSQCDFRSGFIGDMSRHILSKHATNTTDTKRPQVSSAGEPPAKRVAKPLPNLIPILLPATTPKIRSGQSLLKNSSSEKQSKSADSPPAVRPSGSETSNHEDSPEHDPQEEESGSVGGDEQGDKNTFFDQLKLFPGSNSDPNLICVWCGHEAKCTSELVRHNKLHSGQSRGVTVSSTRCQHCRHRCKTHSDLLVHLKTCPKAAEAQSKVKDEAEDFSDGEKKRRQSGSPGKASSSDQSIDSKAFPWNSVPEDEKSGDWDAARDFADGEEGDENPDDEEPDVDAADSVVVVPSADPNLVGVETAPGYGAVQSQNDFEATVSNETILQTVTSLKKVFKCPHCSFWASTASRFHVHIVGHLNKKPFECSLCCYRSNWRWDITKHIRLKIPRDPAHEGAKVLMTDETGRRNYSKYNKYLMLLRVAEPTAENVVANNGRQSKAVANGMQGNVTGPVDPVPILPAPPKLTRAPAPRPCVQVPTVISGALLRPPPPLQAGTTHLIILPAGVRLQQPQAQSQAQSQGQAQGQEQDPGSPRAQSPSGQATKRPAEEPLSAEGPEPKKANSEIKKTVWRCKQCHFRDGDRAVVLAHVKGHYRQQQEAALAKFGASNLQPTPKADVPFVAPVKRATLHCEICPYTTVSEAVLEAHIRYHKQTSEAIFKCYLCPYFVNRKDDLLQHINMHKIEDKKAQKKGAEVQKNNTNDALQLSAASDHERKTQKEVSKTPTRKEDTSLLENDTDCREAGVVQSPQNPPSPLDVRECPDIPYCWVLRNEKLVKMYRCRFCPHVNSRKSNIVEHERMHGKRPAAVPSESGEAVVPSQYMPYPCPDCSYVCNNAGVLSSHMKVHLMNYPQAYSFVSPIRNDVEHVNEIIEKFGLKVSRSPAKSSAPVSPPKEIDLANENNLRGVDLMSLLNPNQSLTDAILAMKKKFNLELDGEPFAEPQEDFLESPPTSPLKQLNEDIDPISGNLPDEKKLHFCRQCPARFLFRKELGIHARFHNLHLVHRCENCSYTARQRTHLQAHFKVHTDDYQERTSALLKLYEINKDYPMPRTAAIAQKPGMQGAVWVVVNAVTRPLPTTKAPVPSAEKPKRFCSKCPATFFKAIALQYHETLHGGDGAHKCNMCDYAVKTYGNLSKHMILHGVQIPARRVRGKKQKQLLTSTEGNSEPEVVDKLLNIKDEVTVHDNSSPHLSEKDDVKENDPVDSPSKVHDEQLGLMIIGSPNFVYPTYCRNGRVKEKRYKCHKCPSAFEKREQYNIHLALHGSNQRYTCSKCDYSVKYYANYIQHLRRHKSSDEAKAATSEEPSQSCSEVDEFTSEDSENIPTIPPSSPNRSAKTTGGKGEKLSVADKQAMMIMQQRRAKRTLASRETLDKNYWCSHCPYSSPRRDQVESHMKRHIAESGMRNAYVCEHCDYSVPNRHFLRDHYKLHFDVSKTPRPDAYMICDQLELWASGSALKSQSKGKSLIFQDRACVGKTDRFMPPLSMDEDCEDDSHDNRVLINLKTLEPETQSGIGDKVALDGQEGSENLSDTVVDEEMKDDCSLSDSVKNETISVTGTPSSSSPVNSTSFNCENDTFDDLSSTNETDKL